MPVLGCMPPWLSDRDHCDMPFLLTTPEHKAIPDRLYSFHSKAKTGRHYESETCRLPCSYYSFHSAFRDTRTKPGVAFKKFNLFFSEAVKE